MQSRKQPGCSQVPGSSDSYNPSPGEDRLSPGSVAPVLVGNFLKKKLTNKIGLSTKAAELHGVAQDSYPEAEQLEPTHRELNKQGFLYCHQNRLRTQFSVF